MQKKIYDGFSNATELHIPHSPTIFTKRTFVPVAPYVVVLSMTNVNVLGVAKQLGTRPYRYVGVKVKKSSRLLVNFTGIDICTFPHIVPEKKLYWLIL